MIMKPRTWTGAQLVVAAALALGAAAYAVLGQPLADTLETTAQANTQRLAMLDTLTAGGAPPTGHSTLGTPEDVTSDLTALLTGLDLVSVEVRAPDAGTHHTAAIIEMTGSPADAVAAAEKLTAAEAHTVTAVTHTDGATTLHVTSTLNQKAP